MLDKIGDGLLLKDFLDAFAEQPFELINGRQRIMPPVKFGHSSLTKLLYDVLLFFLHNKELGDIFMETAFVIQHQTDWVSGSRIPDVMFIREARLNEYLSETEQADDKPLALVPDFVIEVVSPTDKYSDVNEKIEAYLTDDVALIWVVDPQRQTVSVHSSQSPQGILYRKGDILTGGDILPGFELAVSQLFK